MTDNPGSSPFPEWDEWYEGWQQSAEGQWTGQFLERFYAENPEYQPHTWEQESAQQQPTVPYYEEVGPITRFFMDRLPGWTQSVKGTWERYCPDWAKEGYEGIKPVLAPIFKVGMEVLDIAAEGLERLSGMGVQYAHAAATGTTDEYMRNIGAAWKASHWTWNVLGNDLLNYYYDEQAGKFQIRIASWNGPEQIARLRRMYNDGMSHEEVDEAMMNDHGALWFRGAMWDAIGHIFIDPMFWGMSPKVMQRASKWASNAVGRMASDVTILKGEENLRNAAHDLANAEQKLEDLIAASRGVPTQEMAEEIRLAENLVSSNSAVHDIAKQALQQITGKGPTWYETLILKATNQWSPTLAESLEDTFRWTKPWTWFSYTRQSKQTEVLYKASDALNHAISGAEDIEDAMKIVDQCVQAILNPQTGGWIVSPAARSLQSVVMQTTEWFKSLRGAVSQSVQERFLLRLVADGLGTDTYKVLDMLQEEGGIEKVLGRLAEVAKTIGDDAPGTMQVLRDMVRPAEGLEPALNAGALKSVVTMFGDGAVPHDLIGFKLQLISRMGESVAQSLVLSGGVEAAGTFQKATAMLKAAETLGFLRWNPGYLFRNFFNNEISCIANGTFGFAPGKKFWDEGFWLKIWDRMDVMAPSRLRSGITMAQIEELKTADKTVKAALEAASETLRAARQGEYGWMDKIKDTFTKMNFGKLDAGMWSAKAEQWASLRAYTIGMEKARSELAQIGKGLTDVRDYFTKNFPDLDPDLLPQALTGAIHATVKECRNAKEVRAALYDFNLNANWGVIMERTAARMGIPVDTITDFIGPEVKVFMEDAIMGIVRAGGGEEDLNYVLWQTHKMVQKHIDDLVRAGGDPLTQQTMAMLRHNQPHVAMVHLYGRQMDEYHDAYLAHRKATDAIARDIRTADMTYEQTRAAWKMRNQAAQDFWKRLAFRQEARAKAIEAAIADGTKIDTGLQKAYQNLHSSYEDFFTEKNAILDKFFSRTPDYWDDLKETQGITRADEYERITQQIDNLFAVAEQKAQSAYKQIDTALIAQLEAQDPNLGVFATAWRRTVRELRQQQINRVNRFYGEEALNRPTDPDELTTFMDQWSQEMVGHHNLLLQAEREGLDSLSTGLPFGMNHSLDPQVRAIYQKHLLASENQKAVRDILDFMRTEENPHQIIEMTQRVLDEAGIDLVVAKVGEEFEIVLEGGEVAIDEFVDALGQFSPRAIQPSGRDTTYILEELVAAAGGDPDAYEGFRQGLKATLDDCKARGIPFEEHELFAERPWWLTALKDANGNISMNGDYDALQLFKHTLTHELTHAHSAIEGRAFRTPLLGGTTLFEFSFNDPMTPQMLRFIDPDNALFHRHMFPYSPIFKKNLDAIDVSKASDAELLSLYNSMSNADQLELNEYLARTVSYFLIDRAGFEQTYAANGQIIKFFEDWVDQNPQLFNALAGRGRFANARAPMAIAPQAIQKQSQMMAAEIHALLQRANGGSYSPYYLRNMSGTDGYAVVMHKPVLSGPDDAVTIQRFIDDNADLLADPRNMVGWWKDPDTGALNLEISTIVSDRTEAIRLGRAYGQKAIYDLKGTKGQGLIPMSGPGSPRGRYAARTADWDDPLNTHNIQLPNQVAGPSPTGPAMDFAHYQRLVPEMFQPGGTLDAMWASDGVEFLNALRTTVKQQMDLPPLYLEDEIGKLPAHLQGRVRAGIRGYGEQISQDVRGVNLAASQHGEWARDVALLNYHKRTHFDHYTGMIFPFSFWTWHTAYKWFWFSAIEKPYILADWYRINQALTQHGTAKLPSRHNNMVPIGKLPFLPDWMGGIYVNPIKGALPFDYWFDPVFREESRAVSSVRRAERILQQGLDAGDYSQQHFDMAMNHQSGPAWEDAILRAKGQTTEGYDPIETLSWMVAPHAPIMWGYHAMKGQPEKIGPFLPATRTLKGISALLGAPHGGVNVEAWMRKRLGLPAFDEFDEYRVERMLANMVAEGELSHPEAMRAMYEKRGNKWYDIAEERAGSEYGISALGSAFGISARAYPPGEEASRALVDGLHRAYDREDAGEEGIVNQYFDDHPEVATRLALFDDKDTRLQQFLIDEIWDKYMSMPTLHKRAIRDEFGDHFTHYFLNSETRNEREIPIEMLAVWLKLLGGDPPGTLKEAENVPPLPLADPEIADRAQVFYDTRNRDYPNWYDLQSRYYRLPEGSSDRRKFRKENPELVDYWNWRRDWMLRNPTITPYLTDNPPDYESVEEMEEAFRQEPSLTWSEWSLMLPPSTFLFVDRAMRGESMPQEARDELTFIAEGMGMTVEQLIQKLMEAYSMWETGS